MNDCKMLIGVPSNGQWHPDFALSLINATIGVMQNGIRGYDRVSLRVLNKRGSILPQLREQIITSAINNGFDFLCFLDSDQLFPARTFSQLANHKRAVVACNIATKVIPAGPTGRKKSWKDPAHGEPLYTDPTSEGLEEVWRIGCGVMMIHVPSIKHLTQPRFSVEWKSGDTFVGEDWYFCQKLEAAKIPIYVDHDLSKEVGHVGDFIYSHDVVGTLIKE